MECDKCGTDAIHHAAYSGVHLCGHHLRESVEKRVKRRIREDGLLDPDATPDDPDRWVIGLSGGKDSVALTQILDDVLGRDPRVEMLALTIHEGIEGYRDASVDACVELADDLSIRHELVSYEEELDVRMDDVVEDDPEDMAACAYCGVFRRDLLENYATEFDADKLLTGHNLDDEAQTAMMNFLEGDVRQVAKHFDASLGPFDERAETDAFVPRAKPLRDVPEKEIALYCHIRDLPTHMAECPHAEEAYRGEIRSTIHELEANHPGARHSIMAGYEELSALAADAYRGGGEVDDESADGDDAGAAGLGECERCGSQTSRDVCRKCGIDPSGLTA